MDQNEVHRELERLAEAEPVLHQRAGVSVSGIIGREVGEIDFYSIGRLFPEVLTVSEAERERRKRGTLDHRIGGNLAELAAQGLLGAIAAEQYRRLRILRVLHDLVTHPALQ